MFFVMQCTLWSTKYSAIKEVRNYGEEILQKFKSQPLAMISKGCLKEEVHLA